MQGLRLSQVKEQESVLCWSGSNTGSLKKAAPFPLSMALYRYSCQPEAVRVEGVIPVHTTPIGCCEGEGKELTRKKQTAQT